MTLGEKIGLHAKEKGFSIRMLAKKSDIKYSTIYSFIKRRGENLSDDKIDRISTALGINREILLKDMVIPAIKGDKSEMETAIWETINYSIVGALTGEDRENMLKLVNSVLETMTPFFKRIIIQLKKGEGSNV